MWGKNVTTVYIRPQRYTKQFVDGSDTFTLSFFGGEHMKELGYLGKVSGKEEPDKIEKSGLHVEMIEKAIPDLRRRHWYWCAENFTMMRSNRKTFTDRTRM